MRNPKFAALTAEMNALHDRKNADYANDGNPYSNFEEAAQVAAGFSGVDAVFASLIGVKLARLRELTSSGKTPNHESIQDTRTDLAMYATLWASYYRPASITNEQPVTLNGPGWVPTVAIGPHDGSHWHVKADDVRTVQIPAVTKTAAEIAKAPPSAPRLSYDERRSDLKPCTCGAIFTHPHLCDANERCMAAQHPHFRRPLTLAEQRSRNP